MKIFYFLLAALIILIANNNLHSQPPCANDYIGIYYTLPRLTNYPPVTPSMPYDVMIGYIGLDSICRIVINTETCTNFIDHLGFNDTLQYFMKYLYDVTDYDPFRFYEYMKYTPDNYALPDAIEREIFIKIKETSHQPILDLLLSEAYIIAHIFVNNIDSLGDPGSGICHTINIVNCTILDNIKGQNIPNCNPTIFKKKKDEKITSGQCINFEYCCEWPKNHTSEYLCDNGPWITSNNEYIVFLRPFLVCNDELNVFMTLLPSGADSYTFGMFPIVNGQVQDPMNELGFGTSVQVDSFKSFLRNRIFQITNY
jgi:hypothetical protein